MNQCDYIEILYNKQDVDFLNKLKKLFQDGKLYIKPNGILIEDADTLVEDYDIIIDKNKIK